MITLVLVEDHVALRTALTAVVAVEDDLRVVAGTSSGDEAAALVAEHAPDVAVVDLDLPGRDGVAVIAAVRAASPSTACVVLTGSRDPVDLGRAVEAGAVAVLHKSADVPELLDAVRAAAAGHASLPARDTATWLQALAAHRRAGWQAAAGRSALSPRETEILGLLAGGATTDAIAATLVISPQTVQTHVRNLMGKLGVRSRLEAVTYAMRHGLVAPPAARRPDDVPGPG